MTDQTPHPHFPATLDGRLLLDRSGSAIFGRNVLAELVTGIEAALAEPTSKRRLGSVVVGCAAFMDDPALIDALGRVANACNRNHKTGAPEAHHTELAGAATAQQ
jgi:hypothetical protein